LFPLVSNGHKIYLKNGRIVEIEDFWKENNNLCYDKFGSVIKIPESNIDKIEYTTKTKTEDVLNNELAITDINSTEELETIEKQCKIFCEEAYEKCAYSCLENTEQNNCKSECRFEAKNCKVVCNDEFMKNNLAFLKHEYHTSEKPIGELYYYSGPPDFLESDKKMVKVAEHKLKKSRKRGRQYWENKVKSYGNKPAWFLYNRDVYFREIDLLEAKKEYDLHKYGRRVSFLEYNCHKKNIRCDQIE
jgi:hypothetical protein